MGYSERRVTGLVHHDPARAFAGYTLVTTMQNAQSRLVDMDGKVVHAWRAPEPGWQFYYTELLDNGNLLALFIASNVFRPGGCDVLVELDWEGRIVWRHDDTQLHHVFLRRRNGMTRTVRWEELPKELANRLQTKGGYVRSGPELTHVLSDALRDVRPDGSIAWEWHAKDHLDPQIDRVCPLHKWEEWTHCNSVDEDADGRTLLCFRITDALVLLDPDGKITWRWGHEGQLGHPHDATFLPDGNILVFDNRFHQVGQLDASRIIEVDPRTDKIVWQYTGKPLTSFFAAHLGGAQRLPNGNTLVVEGSCGRLFEVTREGETVWEFVNPFTNHWRDDPNSPRLLKARRYAADSGAIRGRV
jgi:hypothetical protein